MQGKILFSKVGSLIILALALYLLASGTPPETAPAPSMARLR